MNVRRQLEERLGDALAAATGREDFPAMVIAAARPEFGDYQANGVMPAAKALKTNPRKLAEKVAAAVDLSDLAEEPEIAGPGFINIRLRADWIAAQLTALAEDARLGADTPHPRQTVVVDYCAPNLAKEMHVGHLRSTIIGDALARVLEFLGQKVIRQNHVGDWGTQFGMLAEFVQETRAKHGGIVGLRSGDGAPVSVAKGYPISDLDFLYHLAQKRFDDDGRFQKRARDRVVRLQSGDAATLDLWGDIRNESLRHCDEVYERLGLKLTRDDVRGESFYNKDLPKVVEALRTKGLLEESEGAQCVFLDEFKGKDGTPLPVIVQKSDGGYLYATTDLAAVRYRVNELKADRILYVIDSRQSLHLRQVFAVARKAGFAPEGVSLEHVSFGTMMGTNGRPFKTREGGTVKLMDLLDEAESAAGLAMDQRQDLYGEARTPQTYRAVGIGAVKYADLAQNRTSDYVFSFDKMLSLDGNTAPYMQYAYARIRSIFRKSGQPQPDQSGASITLAEPAERALGLRLLQFPETLQTVAQECLPNLLCAYLYDLATAFTGFYENCPVLQSSEPTRSSRLALCALTASIIRQGLDLLGIQTLEQM